MTIKKYPDASGYFYSQFSKAMSRLVDKLEAFN